MASRERGGNGFHVGLAKATGLEKAKAKAKAKATEMARAKERVRISAPASFLKEKAIVVKARATVARNGWAKEDSNGTSSVDPATGTEIEITLLAVNASVNTRVDESEIEIEIEIEIKVETAPENPYERMSPTSRNVSSAPWPTAATLRRPPTSSSGMRFFHIS
jgi:hypothetical protein